jgi:hypothetical protein
MAVGNFHHSKETKFHHYLGVWAVELACSARGFIHHGHWLKTVREDDVGVHRSNVEVVDERHFFAVPALCVGGEGDERGEQSSEVAEHTRTVTHTHVKADATNNERDSLEALEAHKIRSITGTKKRI